MLGYRVGDCSAEGGTRLGCVSQRRAWLYLLHRAPRPYPLIARCALSRGPLLLPPPLPPHPPSHIYRGEGRGVLLRYTGMECVRRGLHARWSGARLLASLAYKVWQNSGFSVLLSQLSHYPFTSILHHRVFLRCSHDAG
jgi:hypothetical protein